MGGGALDSDLAGWIEQAPKAQWKAMSSLRDARNPAMGLLPDAKRRALLLRAYEHLVTARRLLARAQDAAPDGELTAALEPHRAQLERFELLLTSQLHAFDECISADGNGRDGRR